MEYFLHRQYAHLNSIRCIEFGWFHLVLFMAIIPMLVQICLENLKNEKHYLIFLMSLGLSILRVPTEFLNLSKLLSKTVSEPLRPTTITLFPDAKK
jgi:hypothetical protein